MKEIVLTKGYVALVDDEDYERVSAFKWTTHIDNKNGRIYAVRNHLSKPNSMHRFILNETNPNIHVDHRNDNGIDNQKHNLRRATPSCNQANTGKFCNNTSGFKGVHWDKVRKAWAAQISVDNKKLFIGRFDQKEDAAKAYDVKAKLHFGEFARFNFPKEEVCLTN
jgi:hypothetical protein